MSWKCALCGKSVYFAERKQAEGKDWHNICFNQYYKKKRQQDAEKINAEYTKVADVCPECGELRKDSEVRFCAGCGYKFQ
ncbi:zinc finger protein [Entamoeba histolytica]|uniref:Zinc finger protein n=2 Tax=Entamoeba TaxID=5758 RepID=A0A175JPZ8_ENTHI|nr:zinc finger protein [Entamoeba histolytica]